MSDITARLADALERIACLESDLEEAVTRSDYWEYKATELARDVGTLLRVDVGEHSNLNCPVQNAIDGVFEMQGTEHLWRQRDALESRPAGWASIESAPRDGTPILGRWGDKVTACRYWTAEQICEVEGGSPDDFVPGWWDLDDWDCDAYPKYWMPLLPLPAPPKTAPVSTEEAK